MALLFEVDRFESLNKAVTRLEEAVERSKGEMDTFLQDALIFRFRVSIEQFWKILKCFLAHESLETNSPREAIQQAYRTKLIDDEPVWLAMLQDRNVTSHLYDKAEAQAVLRQICETYAPAMRKTYNALSERFNTL